MWIVGASATVAGETVPDAVIGLLGAAAGDVPLSNAGEPADPIVIAWLQSHPTYASVQVARTLAADASDTFSRS